MWKKVAPLERQFGFDELLRLPLRSIEDGVSKNIAFDASTP